MSEIILQVETTSLKQSKSKLITGVVFFDFGDGYRFPEQGWNDFVVIVLCWWLSSLKRLVCSNSDEEEFRFMDGPLAIKIKRRSDNFVSMEFFNESTRVDESLDACYQIKDIARSVFDVSKKVYLACYRQGWECDELLELKSLIHELECYV